MRWLSRAFASEGESAEPVNLLLHAVNRGSEARAIPTQGTRRHRARAFVTCVAPAADQDLRGGRGHPAAPPEEAGGGGDHLR